MGSKASCSALTRANYASVIRHDSYKSTHDAYPSTGKSTKHIVAGLVTISTFNTVLLYDYVLLSLPISVILKMSRIKQLAIASGAVVVHVHVSLSKEFGHIILALTAISSIRHELDKDGGY